MVVKIRGNVRGNIGVIVRGNVMGNVRGNVIKQSTGRIRTS